MTPAAEREAIALAMWGNLGRVMAEIMQIDRLISEPGRIEIASQKVFARYKDKLGPAIGVSLHMGNWELAIWPLTIAGANPAADGARLARMQGCIRENLPWAPGQPP